MTWLSRPDLGLLQAATLFLATTVLTHDDPIAADYFVPSLPGAPAFPPIKMHAGHIEVVPESNGNLFFWHYQNQHIDERQRTVIWLNGGPGCSSEDGALIEIGPYRVGPDLNLTYNNGSWNEYANLLFVDQPVGTGYSYVDTNSYISELTDMATDFVTFLEKWFTIFPEYLHDEIYIAGESFAGQYIPYIADAILKRNQKAKEDAKWNLQGLLIGNGWISPAHQYRAYIDYAYKNQIIDQNSSDAQKLEKMWITCKAKLELESSATRVDQPECEDILSELLLRTPVIVDGKQKCRNMYDIRLLDDYPSCGAKWPPDLPAVTDYLRRPDVVKALHVNEAKNTAWSECSAAVSAVFRPRKSPPAVTLLPEILKKIPVVLFSGEADLICNHVGTEKMIADMEWNGRKGFELAPGSTAPQRSWLVEDEEAGFWQEARNLTYVLFHNASHMVPFDYPRRSRAMLERFTRTNVDYAGGWPVGNILEGEDPNETTHQYKKPFVDEDAEKQKEEEQKQKQDAAVDDAVNQAYRKSGGAVLAVFTLSGGLAAFLLWRRRRNGKRGGVDRNPQDQYVYQNLANADAASREAIPGKLAAGSQAASATPGLEGYRSRPDDLEAGRANRGKGELSEGHELDTLATDRRYSIGGDSDDSDDDTRKVTR